MHVQAIHQFHAVVFNGLGADLQDLGNLLGVLAFGDQLENFALPARQLLERAFRLAIPSSAKFLGSREEISWLR